MGLSYKSVLPFSPEEIFAWHERPGAIRRLLPPWLPVRVVEEAASLRDGRAVLGLPLGLRLVAEHRPDGYQPPYSFVDEVARLGWRHTRLFSATGEGSTLVEDRARAPLPAALLRQMFAYRHRQLAGDLAAHARAGAEARGGSSTGPVTVAITGSSGLIGSALAAFLTSGGHRVVRLVRRAPAGPDERRWDPAEPAEDVLAGVQAVVHLAGVPIMGRFTEGHKRSVRESRTGPTRRLAEVAARAAAGGGGPSCFVSASAVGYYGYDRGGEQLDEASSQGDGFVAALVGDWEAATAPAADAGLRVVNVRTGLALSPRGGVLGLLYPVFLAGFGGKLGSGRQWMSWVGLDDLLDIYLRALVDPNLSGPVNAVSPAPVTNAEFARVLASVLRRPALLSVPAVVVNLALGREGAQEFALAGQRVMPGALTRAGHEFRHPGLEVALRHLLGRWDLW